MDNNGVENLVRRILNSLNDNGNSGNSVGTNDERQGRNEQTSRIADPDGPVPNTTQQELYRRFGIPRVRDNGTQSERGEWSSNATNAELLSRQYNPSHNYGYGNSVRRTRVRQPTPYTRRNQRSASAVPLRPASITTKEVILLTSPDERDVPKFATKLELHKNGMILDAVEIDRNWSEKQLIEKLEALFAHKLNGTR